MDERTSLERHLEEIGNGVTNMIVDAMARYGYSEDWLIENGEQIERYEEDFGNITTYSVSNEKLFQVIISTDYVIDPATLCKATINFKIKYIKELQ